MKIQWDGKPLPPASSPSGSAPSREVNAPRFADTLKSALSTQRSGTPAPLGGMGGLRPPMEISPAARGVLDTVPLVGIAETTIDRLEHFVSRLADAKVEVRSLGPLVAELSARKDELGAAYSSLPDTHPLKEIVGELLETMFSAIGQFNRGDFGA